MSRGSRIIAIGGENPQSPEQTATAALADEAAPDVEVAEETWLEEDEASPITRSWSWLVPALAGLLIAGWTGLFAWTRMAEFTLPIPPARVAEWIGAWSPPVLLVCVAWLLVMRNSRREAVRFGDAARLLSEESARLEQSLGATNRELSLAREFIAAQSRDLDALGRIATERLSTHADRLQALIAGNGQQVEAIATVSEAALENMERLRGQLPVIANSAKDATNNIANAGRTAHAQLQEMIEGFKRINEFGQASERQVLAIRAQVNETIDEFGRQATQLDEITTARFAALGERSEAFRADLDSHEVEVLAAIRARASALADELQNARTILDDHEAESLTSLRARLAAVRDESTTLARSLREAEERALGDWQGRIGQIEADLNETLGRLMEADRAAMDTARQRLVDLVDEAQRFDAGLAERNRSFDAASAERREKAEAENAAALARMAEQLAGLDAELAARREAQTEDSRRLTETVDAIAATVAGFEARMHEVAGAGEVAKEKVAASLSALSVKLAEARNGLEGTDRQVAELTDAAVRLLELIQAGIQHSRADLPAALASGEAQLAQMEERIFALREAAGEASSHGADLSNYVIAAQATLDSAGSTAIRLHEQIAARNVAHSEALGALTSGLDDVDERTEALAAKARGELAEAIEKLSTAASEAVASLGEMSRDTISGIAQQLGLESEAAIDRAMRERAAEAAGQLELAASQAASISREAAMQLRDQLAKVNELASNLERRVNHARERAEEQVDNDFARRIALITDSLNSNAIDIAKALSSDVSDMAWAAYLRGDRGIFTRRAVTLLETGEARAIVQVYEGDREFRDHVNRFIHDFEGMLRQLLSTRDGHALGVTLLSSDMGKLYVALAQAIERLRD